MKLLLLSTAYNGLTQRAHLELQAAKHEVYLELAISDRQMIEAVAGIKPELIICPFLKSKIPEAIWRKTRTVIIHPGIVGDRGPSSLDWAIHHGETQWGVTALEASQDFDAGDVWVTETFKLRNKPKASIYRQEVTDAAISCILKTVEKVRAGEQPTPLHLMKHEVKGRLRPLMLQVDRNVDWQRDSTLEIIRQIHAADSFPGVLSTLCELEVYLYGAHEESMYRGKAGDIIALRDGAVCIATTDGAVWISHLRQRGTKDKRYLKLPAAQVLDKRLTLEESSHTFTKCKHVSSYHEIWYDESEDVGYLHFDFHNGAMSTEQCQRLRRAFQWAKTRPTKVIALVGGEDFHSNGIHLNVIEAADDSAYESWRNINAINDLILELLTCTSHLTVSAVQGNAGAGGVFFALASDYVVARSGRIFNPHYKTMGLHGSEYWTYLLPKRIGAAAAKNLTENCLPLSAENAFELGLVDVLIDAKGAGFMGQLASYLYDLCEPTKLPRLLQSKRATIPTQVVLEQHRRNELMKMQQNFRSPAYHTARKAFVYKESPTETPNHLALHRQQERVAA
jgi:putative two-component system protein, hydrogenase maturation factor HypX/HoxX